MTIAMRIRASKALVSAESIGGVHFTKVYVVGNEMTFSKKAAQRMVEDANRVILAEYHKRFGSGHVAGDMLDTVTMEVITFEQAYQYHYGVEYVPERVLKTAYKEMDEIETRGEEGALALHVRDEEKYYEARKNMKLIQIEEAEAEAERKARKAANRKVNKQSKTNKTKKGTKK